MTSSDALRASEVTLSVSVVVATRDRLSDLERCLRGVLAQMPAPIEILVVDSAPLHTPAADVAARLGARYLHASTAGASRARNAGARVAAGDIVVFFDDDAVPQPGCLAAILVEFGDERVAAVAGRTLLSGSGDAASAFASYGAFDVGSERRVIDATHPDWFEMVNFGGVGAGAVMAFRRSAFESWGGFDERLGRGAPQDCSEEPHAYFSLVKRGHRVVYAPDAIVTHPPPASLAGLRDRQLRDAAAAAAYMCLLYAEHPAQRRAVLRYAVEALRGKPRTWRPRPATARYSVVPRWRERLAWTTGPLLYLRMRSVLFFRRLLRRVP